jgi:hypothetical protein
VLRVALKGHPSPPTGGTLSAEEAHGRKLFSGCWPPPEYGQNMDTKQMGNLGLTTREVDAIVAYMRAMTDQ